MQSLRWYVNRARMMSAHELATRARRQARFGAERLLFGTNMPQGAGSAAIAMITYADISLEEKKLIASENLNRILGGVKI